MNDADIMPALRRHLCPDCGHGHFYRGPSGGLAVNVECVECGARFNVSEWHGSLVAAQRIGHEGGEWPDRGFW